MSEVNYEAVLATVIEKSDFNAPVTVRHYLNHLLSVLWYEEEGFSGKRPFGNSGWQYDVYAALVRDGLIEGELDEDGYILSFNNQEAKLLLLNTINHVFKEFV